jgi:putative transposase
MGSPKRAADGGLVYHVLNRCQRAMTIVEDDVDYAAFEQVLDAAVERTQMRLLAYCGLPNHWHLGTWPREDGSCPGLRLWPALTHTQRWPAHRRSMGSGHVYQGRFKSFPVQEDEHTAKETSLLAAWPLPRWGEHVNAPQTEAELAALRRCVQRGRRFGEGAYGASRSSADRDWKARFAPKAAPKSAKTVPDTFYFPGFFGGVAGKAGTYGSVNARIIQCHVRIGKETTVGFCR